MIIQTKSDAETRKLAAKLAKKYHSGGIIALSGPLGAGKTTFAQGFAKGLGIISQIISPTFILMRNYLIPGKLDGQLFHIDLYRLENKIQIDNIGLKEILANTDNLVLIEWPEKLGDNLPKNTLKINIDIGQNNQRTITIQDH